MKTYQTTKRKLTKQPNKRLIQEGADALIDLKDKIDTTKMKKPSFLMVLTAVQTSEGWRFSGSNRLSEGLIVNKGIVTIMARYR